MIRLATRRDIPALVMLCRDHHADMGFAWSFDPAAVSMGLATAIDSDDWLCLTGDRCVLIALVVTDPFGAGRLAIERMLKVARSGDFDALIDAYEAWAIGQGCREASLSTTHRHGAFERLYRRKGYVLAETTCSKAL